MELAVALERRGVEELDGERLGEVCAVDRAEATLAELITGGEGGGGAAQGRVGEAAWLGLIGRCRSAAREAAIEDGEENDKEEKSCGCGGDGEEEGRQVVVRVVVGQGRGFWFARWHD